MRIHTLLLSLGCLVAAFSSEAATTKSSPASKPNIILILTDDVGLGDIGFNGGPFKTPHIDALAKSGTQFDLCYSTPLCGPSRCQTLTGRYPFRTGLINNQSHNAIKPGKEIMIPTVLKTAGYVTASVGKWGQMSFGPGEWGFDEYLVFQGSGKYWASQKGGGYKVNGKNKELGPSEYLPDVMHDFAVDFISRNKEKPFFLYYPMSHVHGPILRTPDSKPGADADQLYTDNVTYMDKLVGKLMAELDRQKLREKTVVLFAGDNGTARFGVETATVNGRKISGQKASMLDGGSHVPFAASWPGVTPAGKVSHDLIDFSDFLGTFAELGGAELPKGLKIDSHSFAAQLRGEKGTPREWVYVELNGKSFARDARYKLTNKGELYDLSEAPYKETLVAADTTDAGALNAKKRLQQVLNEHPTAPGVKLDPKPGRAEKRKQRKKQAAKA